MFALSATTTNALMPKSIFQLYLTTTSLKNLTKKCNPWTLYPLKTKRNTKTVYSNQKKTGLKDAITTGFGNIEGKPIAVACMNFNFIGGSMGSVVGEKSVEPSSAPQEQCGFLMISKCGGARMMEAAYSSCRWPNIGPAF